VDYLDCFHPLTHCEEIPSLTYAQKSSPSLGFIIFLCDQ